MLLILAGVSIATLTGSNGIFNRVNDAKIETALGAVKEALKLEQGEKVIDNKNLTPEILLSEGKVTRTVQQGEEEKYYMYYAIKENAYEGMQGLGKGNIASLKDVFLIDDNLEVKYIASNGKEYGDNLDNKVLEDETEIRFSSKAFSEYVSKISGVSEEELKFKWMKNQTTLTIADKSIDSLQDLVFFPSLTSLTLGDNNGYPPITTLNGIENCTKLKSIFILYGPNKDYTAIRSLENLTKFMRLGGNDYDNIIDSLKFCRSLENLELTGNRITSMKRIEELGDLKSLNLISNEITKIEGLENKSSLTSLNLANNKITKIEGLENLTNLSVLSLSSNQITDIIPLSINTSLTYLELRHNTGINGDRNNYTEEKLEKLNKIGEIIDRGGTINLDIDKIGLFTNYKKLNLTGQDMTTLKPLKGLTQLKNLDLSGNKITLEDKESQDILKSMTNLTELNLYNNKIIDVTAINSLTSLKNLNLIGTENNINLVDIEDIISNLDVFNISTESLKTIVNCNTDKITKLTINSSSNISEIPDLSKFVKLKELSLYTNANIKDLSTISELSSLKILNLTKTNLHGRMIDFSKLKNLTNLNLSNNTLWDEDLENLKALKNNTNLTIDLSNNSIINATALLELNPNTRINLSGNVNLTKEAKEKLKGHFQERVTF